MRTGDIFWRKQCVWCSSILQALQLIPKVTEWRIIGSCCIFIGTDWGISTGLWFCHISESTPERASCEAVWIRDVGTVIVADCTRRSSSDSSCKILIIWWQSWARCSCVGQLDLIPKSTEQWLRNLQCIGTLILTQAKSSFVGYYRTPEVTEASGVGRMVLISTSHSIRRCRCWSHCKWSWWIRRLTFFYSVTGGRLKLHPQLTEEVFLWIPNVGTRSVAFLTGLNFLNFAPETAQFCRVEIFL